MRGVLATVWGVFGVCLLLGSAIYRLGSRAVLVSDVELTPVHLLVLAGGLLFMIYSEGYKGFQQSFSPRVAARAKYLWSHADTSEMIFAPFFMMGYWRAEKRRKIISYSLTIGIICMVLLVRLFPSPWREIVDLCVVVGLLWGLISFLVFLYAAFTSPRFSHSPEVPGYALPLVEEG